MTFPMNEAQQVLIDLGRFAQDRGWVPATAGNFSIRLNATDLLMTASGLQKGEMQPTDCLRLTIDQPLHQLPRKPSAETELHREIYRRIPAAAVVAHVHSFNNTVLSLAYCAQGHIRLTGYELIKVLFNRTTHEDTVILPILPNSQDMDDLARQMGLALNHYEGIVGILLAGHGLYTWGTDQAELVRHMEAIEFLLECFYREHLLGMRRVK